MVHVKAIHQVELYSGIDCRPNFTSRQKVCIVDYYKDSIIANTTFSLMRFKQRFSSVLLIFAEG